MNARRVQNPPNGVVHRFRLRERLVPTLVPDDPDACAEETRPEAVHRPQRKACSSVEVWVWEVECGGRDESVKILGALARSNDNDEVPDAAKQSHPLSLLFLLRKRESTHT